MWIGSKHISAAVEQWGFNEHGPSLSSRAFPAATKRQRSFTLGFRTCEWLFRENGSIGAWSKLRGA